MPPRITIGLVLGIAAAWLALAGHAQASPRLPADDAAPQVVLLHGLARQASSMRDMELALREAGYAVCNIAYPSRHHSIAELASQFVAPDIARCVRNADEPISFVTHSLGGIVVRQLSEAGLVKAFGRVVMLGPPNHGSEVVDRLQGWSLFDAINGPAGSELGTSIDSAPRRLGPAGFELGIVAGRHSINWINSLMIPGTDDGKVSLHSARLDGMKDFVVVPVSHPFLMTDRRVIAQTLQFLRQGCFEHADARAGAGAPAELPCVPSAAP